MKIPVPWIIRLFICLIWLAVMAIGLYSPLLFQDVRSERSITIFTWPQVFDGKVIRKFEKDTGIKVYVSFYEGNQELLKKLQATRYHGYDIIIPSDYMVQQLQEKGLIKKFSPERIAPLKARILPSLLNHYFDKGNQYSLPYNWYLYGIGIDSRVFTSAPEASWALLFDPNMVKNYRLGMTSDPRETIFLAALYLFGDTAPLQQPENVAKIIQLLCQQKEWVSVYTDLRLGDVLLSGEASIVMSNGSDMIRAKRIHDYIQLVIPKEGTFMAIDSIAISSNSSKDDLIYIFLEYIYRPEVIMQHYQLFAACPVISGMPEYTYQLYHRAQEARKIFFLDNSLRPERINEIWLDLLSS